MACDEEETERLQQNKMRKKWKEAKNVASQLALKSQTPSVSQILRTLC